MAQDKPPTRRRLPYILRIIRARPRLAFSALVGLVTAVALPSAWSIATRLLLAWDAGVVLYLVLVYTMMAHSETGHIRTRALAQDEGRIAMLVLTVFAATASLAAILAELGSGQGVVQATGTVQAASRSSAQLALAAGTIVLSWIFIHTMFALHYAHGYYSARGAGKNGLSFPGEEAPDYWDFVYFSVVIGMTSQVSDVAVASRPMRRSVTAHGIISFFFNAALLALMVNIAASAI
jgi:uncharacterized membrane protein